MKTGLIPMTVNSKGYSESNDINKCVKWLLKLTTMYDNNIFFVLKQKNLSKKFIL